MPMTRSKKAFDKLSIPARKAMGRLPQAPWTSVLYELNPRLIRAIPPPVALERLRLEGDRQLVAFGPKHQFWLPSGCELNGNLWGEYLSVFWNHPANRHNYFRYPPVFSPESVIVDCGAFCGFFTQLALEGGAGKVIAVEPNPETGKCLESTFSKQIAEGRVVLKLAALNQTSCRLKYQDEAFAPFGGSISTNSNGTDVHGVCLDELIPSLDLARLDFLKMDIEGFEIQALLGAVRSLRKFRPQLSVTTYHRCADFQMLRHWLRTIGYAHIRSSGLCSRPKDVPAGLRPVMIYAWA